jgi:hypothetical protein
MKATTIFATLVPLCLALFPEPAAARIKLAAQPERERVEIQLDNGRYTLVEEERIVPLLASSVETGNNFIDFSWANARIDKDSIQFRPLAVRSGGEFGPLSVVDGKPEVAVINVAYPPNENALVWEVYAKRACALRVRVSYLVSNLTRTFSYRALADRDETHLTLRSYILLRNYSGEEFGEAGVWAGFGPAFQKEILQQEEIRMLLRRYARVPIRKTYEFDWYSNGPLNPDKPHASKVLMHYEIQNDEAHGLGEFALQPGKARIFIEDGHGKEAFLGEDRASLTPRDDTMRLYLGEARDVVCTRTIQDNERHPVRGNLFDQELRIRYEIQNFKDRPLTLAILEQVNRLAAEYGSAPQGDAEWVLGRDTSPEIHPSTEKGGALPVLRVDLPPRPEDPDAAVEKVTVVFHLRIKNLW